MYKNFSYKWDFKKGLTPTCCVERKVTAAVSFGGQMTHVVLLLRGAAFLSVGNAQWSIIDMMEFKVPFEGTTLLNYLNSYNKALKNF